MNADQRAAAIDWLEDALTQLQVSKIAIQDATRYAGHEAPVALQKAADAVQHALARIAAVRILLVASATGEAP
jgi:hypothetical protein